MFDQFTSGPGDDGDTVFRDVILLTLAGFIVIVLLLLPHINPVANKSDDLKSPGNVIVEMYWSDDITDDIDLWIRAPGDLSVGYSNKAGKVFNLLRDDLGKNGDLSNKNQENAFSRGIVPGEYIINVHHYRGVGNFPVEVRVVMSVKKDADSSAIQLIARTVYLKHEGEELTVVRFKLDEKGNLSKSSINDIFVPLRAAED